MVEANRTPQTNPWKIGVLAAGGVALAVVAGGAVMGALDDDASPERVTNTRAQPPTAAVEDCNRYAANAERNLGEVAKKGLIGGAVGAGVGAAGGAIADGGDGAGKGAGIGAIVGATAGSLYGLSEENRRTEAAREAYSECMARKGYTG